MAVAFLAEKYVFRCVLRLLVDFWVTRVEHPGMTYVV